jgi:hypothetical protein
VDHLWRTRVSVPIRLTCERTVPGYWRAELLCMQLGTLAEKWLNRVAPKINPASNPARVRQ